MSNTWLYQPGSHNMTDSMGNEEFFWKGHPIQDFFSLGIMCIGWDAIGDLSHYASQKDIQESIDSLYEDESRGGWTAWAFLNTMQEGDIIYVKDGCKAIIGKGVVSSGYFYDSGRSRFCHTRKVEWTDCNIPFDLAGYRATLTRITGKDIEKSLDKLQMPPMRIIHPVGQMSEK